MIAAFTFIIACLIFMGFSAYAYFSATVSTPGGKVSSGAYALKIDPPEGLEDAEIYELTEGEYLFTVSCDRAVSSVSVGYCKILVKSSVNDPNNTDDCQSFYTSPIWNSDDIEKPSSRTVKITVPQGERVIVTFISRWGSHSGESIVDGESLDIEF